MKKATNRITTGAPTFSEAILAVQLRKLKDANSQLRAENDELTTALSRQAQLNGDEIRLREGFRNALIFTLAASGWIVLVVQWVAR